MCVPCETRQVNNRFGGAFRQQTIIFHIHYEIHIRRSLGRTESHRRVRRRVFIIILVSGEIQKTVRIDEKIRYVFNRVWDVPKNRKDKNDRTRGVIVNKTAMAAA